MKKNIAALAVLAGLAGVSAASAADLGRSMKDTDDRDRGFVTQADPTWNGLYVGLQGGYGHTVLSGDDDQGGIAVSGLIGGIRAGGDVQRGPVVIGAWAEYNISGQELSLGGTTLVEQTSDWSVNARLGFASGRTLFYGFGGYGQTYLEAFGGDEVDAPLWRAGAGIEHKITNSLSLGLEYTHSWVDADELLGDGADDVLDVNDDRVMAVARFRFGADAGLGIFSGN